MMKPGEKMNVSGRRKKKDEKKRKGKLFLFTYVSGIRWTKVNLKQVSYFRALFCFSLLGMEKKRGEKEDEKVLNVIKIHLRSLSGLREEDPNWNWFNVSSDRLKRGGVKKNEKRRKRVEMENKDLFKTFLPERLSSFKFVSIIFLHRSLFQFAQKFLVFSFFKNKTFN